jgi:hypothetical protein
MRSIIFVFICFLSLTTACSAQKQDKVPDQNQKQLKAEDVLGDWQGESKCTGSNPYCHDEVVLYHFTAVKDDASKVHLAADKLVNGKWELMGEFDFTIDAAKSTLTAEFNIPRTGGRGVWSFTVAGDKIVGTLTAYPENEVGRKVHVERKK